MNNAQAQVDAATARAEQAERDAAATQAHIEALRSQVVAAAVDAYVDPQGDKALDVFRESSANDASAKQALIDATSGAKLDVVDEFRRREAAPRGPARPRPRPPGPRPPPQRDALAQKKAGYDSALLQQQQVANQVSARINDKLAESAALSTLDSQLSAQLQQEQAALAARVKASSSSGGGSGSGGGGGGGGGTVSPVITRPGLSTVGGITVASSIAGQLALAAQRRVGRRLHTLGGSGYRDSSGQIALRRAELRHQRLRRLPDAP